MLYKLAGFPALLRQAGVRVSPGETEDFLKAVSLTGIEKGMLESVALSTLAKGDRERWVTQKFFNLYFSLPAYELVVHKNCNPEGILSNPPRLASGEFLALLDELRFSIRKEVDKLKTEENRVAVGGGQSGAGRGRSSLNPWPDLLWQALCEGNREEMLALVRDAVRVVLEKAAPKPGDFEKLLRQVKVSLDWAAAADRLDKESQCDCRSLLNIENVRKFEGIIIDELDRELWRCYPEAIQEVTGRANLAETDFGLLNLEQVEDIKKMVAKIARSLATRLSYRRARSRKGEVDLRRTIRYAAQTGGVPLVLCRRAKLPCRPELVVLCDLSGSVSLFTGFMLQLIYAVQERFSRVRTFAFVDDVEEITNYLKGQDAGEAIVQVLRGARIAHTPFSDYGTVWKGFCYKFIECVNPKTTVLVLGDARSNWKPSGVEYLERIRERAARIIWLNPAPLERWDRDDSIISQYAPICHRLFECRNLKQLGEVARYLGNFKK